MLIVKSTEEEVLADLAGIRLDQPFRFGSDFLCLLGKEIISSKISHTSSCY